MNRTAAFIACLAPWSLASAQVVYSHFPAQPEVAGFVAPGWEVGNYVTLAGGAAQVGTAEFKFGTSASSPNAAGTLNLNFYNDSGGMPGTLISTFASPVNLVGTGPTVITLSTGSLSLPASVWICVRFVQTSGGAINGVISSPDSPTVGSVSANRVFRDQGTGAWGIAAVSDWTTMQLTAASTSCYANCDASTATPILNANDFQCFLNKYAAGDSSANCDHSTSPPILNANDFQCFLNTFAAGCS